MSTDVRIPALGESVTEATLATWFKKPGDAVVVDEMLCELETDKVTVEVPAPIAGSIAEILIKEGDTVGVDTLIATITEGKGSSAKHSAAGSSTTLGKSEPAKVIDITVPALGESVTEATIATWFKKPGETAAADEPLCELETDKVSVEVSAPTSGKLSEILQDEGATVQPGDNLATFDSSGATVPDAGDHAPSSHSEQPSAKDIENAPSAKKAMAEAGLTPDRINGSGRDGRIMKEDVAAAKAESAMPKASPEARIPRGPVSTEDAIREERVKMTRLRQTIAKRLKDSQNTAAMLTTYNEVDMTEVMALRSEYKDEFLKKHGVKLGFMSFFTKACCHALKEVPEVNAEIDGTDIVYKNFVHMGIAAGTPTGLVVPVIRDADSLSFAEIEKQIAEKGARAREGKLSMAEMQGGTFTISNGGVYGSLMSSPILNPPQSGILGMHKIQQRPMVVNGQIVACPMMYLALSYDHRIVDGKGAVTFLVRVKDALEDPRRLLMDL